MFGRPNPKRLLTRLRRRDFTVWTVVAVVLVAGLIIGAFIDSARVARIKDQKMLATSLKGQLAEFLLLTREPDGTSLLENPQDFGKAKRSLRVVALRRPLFNYFLNKDNARTFKVDEIRWEAPRACLLEFSQVQGGGEVAAPFTIQACFSAIPEDAAGRYIYFALRYPSPPLRRHEAGQPASEVDSIVIRLGGSREKRLTLVFEAPLMIGKIRNANQLRRFDGFHEVSAFLSDEPGRASRLVNAQAYERRADGESSQNIVTVVGRISAAALPGGDENFEQWPTPTINSMPIGLEVHLHDRGAALAYRFEPDSKGTALTSLEQAYLSAVPSKANLEIATNAGEGLQAIWRSNEAGLVPAPKSSGLMAWWGEALVSILGHKLQPMEVKQRQIVAGYPVFEARLTAEPIVLPDLATRAFGWLTLALLMVAVAAALWVQALRRIWRITRTAYVMTVSRGSKGSLKHYAKTKDEIGTLGRVLHLLFSRIRARNALLVKRIHEESAAREAEIRFAQEKLKWRQSVLDAIGHEIRSPLQSLLARSADSQAMRTDLERMRFAVETLYDVTSLENGLSSGNVIVHPVDLATYLAGVAGSRAEEGKPVRYEGPEGAVFGTCDEIVLEQIPDNLITNALRYHADGTTVIIRLAQQPRSAVIDVFNVGRLIPEEDLERIFNYGVSDRMGPDNRGIGLFLSRVMAHVMRGTLEAINRKDGVSLMLTLPSESPEAGAAI